MDLRISHCFVVVQDMDQALTFYRDALELEVRNDVTFENMRWLTLGSPRQPDVQVVLELTSNHPRISADDQRALEDLLAKGLLKGLIFVTDSCDETFGKIRASGAEVLQEPVDQPYGVRDCAFRDPSGNMVRFSQEIPRRP
ncbi:MAG TPA: VOC family protein [Catenuloplanes sp.]|jgi:predicted enzyme related to lactoylglutathione lyase